jgi:hypothetical protein
MLPNAMTRRRRVSGSIVTAKSWTLKPRQRGEVVFFMG